MVDRWFGGTQPEATTSDDRYPKDDSGTAVDISTRRTEQEVLKLVRTFQRVFDESTVLQQRISYFWPSTEFSDRVLFSLARDIPKAENPLWPDDPNEVFPDTSVSQPAAPQRDDHSESSDDSLDLGVGKAGHRRRKKKRAVPTQPKCVEWLGFANERNKFAAIKLTIPATHEPWITWANRVIVFLFAHIPGYAVPEDYVRVLQPPSGGPFDMRCQNPRCIRLSHIKYLPPELLTTLTPTVETGRTQSRPPASADRVTGPTAPSGNVLFPPQHSKSRPTLDQDVRSMGSRAAASGRSVSRRQIGRQIDSVGTSDDGRLRSNMSTAIQREADDSDAEEMTYPENHGQYGRTVWSPGFT